MIEFNENLKSEEKVFWSPAVRWEKTEEQVKIEIFCYKDCIKELFPKFYFLTQKGISMQELIEEFSQYNRRKVESFIKDLLRKRILVSGPLKVQELFYTQSYLFNNKYSEKIRYDESELKKYKKKQLGRICADNYSKKISLNNDEEYPENISNRKTIRDFDTSKPIEFHDFSEVISVFKQLNSEESTRYYYASAGGLYPIDIYFYIKKDRVEGINKGLYYYSPIDNSLLLINDSCVISEDSHFFTNQSIFKDSAVSMFFIYNADVTMPKYSGMGYLYGCIDTGIMVSTLTSVAELYNIGICSIGDMNFNKIEKYFSLNENQIHVHTVELGLKLR